MPTRITTLTQGSEEFKALFGNIQVPLASYIEEQDKQARESCLAYHIFSERQSNSKNEGYSGLSEADEMEAVGSGEIPPLNSFNERDLKIIENVLFKSRITITREAIEDAKGAMKKLLRSAGVTKLTSAYYRTLESLCFGLLIAAAQNKKYYQRGIQRYDTTAYDGKIVFATDRKGGCNAFSDFLTKDTLGRIATAQQNFKSDKGNDITVAANTLIIPNDHGIKTDAFNAIGADKDPGTANDGFNYLFGQFRVIISTRLNALVTGNNKPFILMDGDYNEKLDGNILQIRRDLEIKSKEIDGDVNAWDASARLGAGFVDWRQMAIGGVEWGKALT